MENNYKDREISLKELILTLVKGWKTIAVILLITLLSAFIYVVFVAEEVFEASVEGTITLSETATTKYGIYTFPSTNKMDYLNAVTSDDVLQKVISNLNLKMSIGTLKSKITVESLEDSSRFKISVKTNDHAFSDQIIEELSLVMMDTLSLNYRKFAVDLFVSDYNVRVKNSEASIEKKQKTLDALRTRLSTISPTITLKKLITSDPALAAKIANERGVSLESLTDEVMFEEISNPTYELLEESIINAEAAIFDLNSTLEQDRELYAELEQEEKAIQTYYQTGSKDQISDASLELMKSRISISNYVSSSDQPVAPNKVLTMAVALVLGLMVGVFVAFFKAYWLNN